MHGSEASAPRSCWRTPDLERGILTGTILEVRDRRTREREYRIRDTTRFSEAIEQVVKLGPNGKLVVTPSTGREAGRYAL